MEGNKTLLMLVGFPRSGKTTWASQKRCPIVNPDAIRMALHGRAFVADAEPMVWAIARYMVKALFLAGHNEVVLDACNNSRKRRDPWKDVEAWSRYFIIFATPASVCRDRVEDGENADGLREAIDRMNDQHEPVTAVEGPFLRVEYQPSN